MLKAKIKSVLLFCISVVKNNSLLKKIAKKIVLNVPFLKRLYIRIIGQPVVAVVDSRVDLSYRAHNVFILLKSAKERLDSR